MKKSVPQAPVDSNSISGNTMVKDEFTQDPYSKRQVKCNCCVTYIRREGNTTRVVKVRPPDYVNGRDQQLVMQIEEQGCRIIFGGDLCDGFEVNRSLPYVEIYHLTKTVLHYTV
ncbi:hypothetical protein TNCT_629241 [Trichonephila clavata]|uniref:Uncharacterized protein n=1 Tax=Trichonephila clavata TaxID=2740835 RepID=A0A8X6G947_TRICU|nr:hypothetical protein TNCT_629241 [Trichonephila clavata]